MVVVHHAHGLRFIIYVDDHQPAHVHVHGDGDAKVVIVGSNGEPYIVRVVEMTRADQRRMMREIRTHQSMFLKHWEDVHGGSDR